MTSIPKTIDSFPGEDRHSTFDPNISDKRLCPAPRKSRRPQPPCGDLAVLAAGAEAASLGPSRHYPVKPSGHRPRPAT